MLARFRTITEWIYNELSKPDNGEDASFAGLIVYLAASKELTETIRLICVTLVISSDDPKSLFYHEKFPADVLGIIIQYYLSATLYGNIKPGFSGKKDINQLITYESGTVIPLMKQKIHDLKTTQFNVRRFLLEADTYSQQAKRIFFGISSYDWLIDALKDILATEHRSNQKNSKKNNINVCIQKFVTKELESGNDPFKFKESQPVSLLKKFSLLGNRKIAENPEKPGEFRSVRLNMRSSVSEIA